MKNNKTVILFVCNLWFFLLMLAFSIGLYKLCFTIGYSINGVTEHYKYAVSWTTFILFDWVICGLLFGTLNYYLWKKLNK